MLPRRHLFASIVIACAVACRRAPTPAPAPSASQSSSVAPSPDAASTEPRWTNVGIDDARFRDLGDAPFAESGRVMAIRTDPRDANVVYIATVGGVWKTTSFASNSPSWTLLTGDLESAPVGAIDLDPAQPDHVIIGTGDPWGRTPRLGAGVVVQSNDGGASWSAPLEIMAKDARGNVVRAGNVRDLAIDPSSPKHVLVAAQRGLFQSSDGGASFALVGVANTDDAPQTIEAWSIAYLGANHWAVSVLDSHWHGDVWRTTDGGASWSSARKDHAMPLHEKDGGVARMTLTAGDTSSPDATVVFAFVASPRLATVDVFRSIDGAKTFQSAFGTFRANPPCTTHDFGGHQSTYNQAIAVDPTDARRVFVGGELCAFRTTNALDAAPSWEPIAEGGPKTKTCTPYVHMDFHAARFAKTAAGVRIFAGTDGGIAASDNLFAPNACDVRWSRPNRGITNQLVVSIASGDPADGNQAVILAGLQDDGVRAREADGKTWDVVGQGDGHGVAIAKGMEWLGSNGNRSFCKPGTDDCSHASAWKLAKLPSVVEPGDDANAYQTIAIPTDPGAVLVATTHEVYRVDSTPAWSRVGEPLPAPIGALAASPFTPRLYGLVTKDGHCAVTSDGDAGALRWNVSTAVAPPADLGAAIAFPPPAADARAGDVYLCAYGGHVPAGDAPTLFITRDRGATFTPLNGDASTLPNLPIADIACDPSDARGDTILVANVAGVFRTTDGGRAWSRYGAGLPIVPVMSLFISRAGDLVRAGTWGRGVWELRP